MLRLGAPTELTLQVVQSAVRRPGSRMGLVWAPLVEREPGRTKDKLLTSKLATLGIMVGKKSPEPDARMATILAKAEVMGNAMANTIAYQSRAKNIMKW